MTETSLMKAYRENEADLIAFLTRRLHSVFGARDVTQDICVKICSENPPVPESNARGYLFRMAANLATDYQRRERLGGQLQTTDPDSICESRANPTPEELLISRDDLQRLRAAIDELPDMSRRIFYLSRFEGKTQREIARIVGLSPAGVFKHIRNTLEHLATVRDEA